jgi:selenocysteine lyase/cysteine desulfurase
VPGHRDGEVASASPCPAPPPGLAGVRARFSSLQDDFACLDAPGGTQTPDEVAETVAAAYRDASGNTAQPPAAGQPG